jgi:hypothetical protein
MFLEQIQQQGDMRTAMNIFQLVRGKLVNYAGGRSDPLQVMKGGSAYITYRESISASCLKDMGQQGCSGAFSLCAGDTGREVPEPLQKQVGLGCDALPIREIGKRMQTDARAFQDNLKMTESGEVVIATPEHDVWITVGCRISRHFRIPVGDGDLLTG